MRRDLFAALGGAMFACFVFIVLLILTAQQPPDQQPPSPTLTTQVSLVPLCEQLPERC